MQLLCLLPFGILCLSAIRVMFVKIQLAVYVDGYCGLSESELCVGKLCPIGFLVVCECSLVLLQSVVMSYVDCGCFLPRSMEGMG